MTLGQVHGLRKGNVVNVDVNPSPSPYFLFSSIAQCWWGCSPLWRHGVRPGTQTEDYEHEDGNLWQTQVEKNCNFWKCRKIGQLKL
jgi:hypothetical protein